MKVYIITYYNGHDHWGAIESVYTSEKKAEKTLKNLRETSGNGIDHEVEEFEISKYPQVESQF